MNITLDYTKTLEQNAALLYDKAKKAKKKQAGALESIQKTRKLLAKAQVVEKAVEKKERKRVWYDHFHWFISSEGFLVIGGRDATTNEIIIKKHTSKDDAVFHSEIAGSPFFVVQSKGKKIGVRTKEEAAVATASYSRAWRQGLGVVEVFHVKPDQLSKTAQAGEFIPKGAFMVRGKKEIVSVSLGLAVGMYQERIMAGPLTAVKKHCPIVIKISIGDIKTGKAAKFIQKRIGGDLDEIIRALPAGGVYVHQ